MASLHHLLSPIPMLTAESNSLKTLRKRATSPRMLVVFLLR
jgi:hypothetical protein